jgi:hypothetical protein
MDEYFAHYQALVYSSGAAAVPVPAEWADYRLALFHRFLGFLMGGESWFSPYLPIHPLLRAPFILLGAPEILNIAAVAGSIVLIGAIARRIFPNEPWAPLVAALLMAGSAQVLVVGMSAYAHSLLLFFNMAWLALFLSERRWAGLLLPWVGVIALGLHWVHYHLMFAFPFFLYMLIKRQWRWLLYVCPIYALAFLIFSNWHRTAELFISGQGILDFLDWGTSYLKFASAHAAKNSAWGYNFIAGIANIPRLFAWQHLLALPLIVIALVHWKSLPPVIKILAVGCAITLVVRLWGTPNTGHEWGYRYFHNMLGNLVLLAVAGLIYLRQGLSPDWQPRLTRMLCWSSVISLFIFVPIRFAQVNEFIRPYAQASAYLESLPQEVVIIDTASIYIGQDLVRNDPWLRNRPLLMDGDKLTAGQKMTLLKERNAIEVGISDLKKFSLKPFRLSR